MNRCLTSFRWILGALPALIFSTQIYAVDHIQVGLRSGQASLIKKSVTYQTTLKDANQSIKLVDPFFRDATNLLPSEAQQLWDLYFHPSRQQDLSLPSTQTYVTPEKFDAFVTSILFGHLIRKASNQRLEPEFQAFLEDVRETIGFDAHFKQTFRNLGNAGFHSSDLLMDEIRDIIFISALTKAVKQESNRRGWVTPKFDNAMIPWLTLHVLDLNLTYRATYKIDTDFAKQVKSDPRTQLALKMGFYALLFDQVFQIMGQPAKQIARDTVAYLKDLPSPEDLLLLPESQIKARNSASSIQFTLSLLLGTAATLAGLSYGTEFAVGVAASQGPAAFAGSLLAVALGTMGSITLAFEGPKRLVAQFKKVWYNLSFVGLAGDRYRQNRIHDASDNLVCRGVFL